MRNSPMGPGKPAEVKFDGPAPVLTPQVPELSILNKGQKEARSSVLDANLEFYSALEDQDIGRMARTWGHDGGVRCTQPNGVLLRGWEEVRRGFEQMFSVDRPYRIELKQVYAEQDGRIAYVSMIERVAMPQLSRPRSVHAATNVFRWHDGQWRLILHHST